ncbi:hypothetical protein E6O75_ATG08038 [Venturia nashicola]|uniref:Uncharacterized protein n=1 Tax=Venturia nashicola TaxID=86259 RepID=A0A4Z1P4Q7_9PEZI|nr:hypothetical protein E6O75_ATG08038 [Venturia nashicola]
MEPTTRLRKAFRYPSDEDSNSQPEDLDEEEQEVLIKTFIDNDAAKTEAYKVYSLPLTSGWQANDLNLLQKAFFFLPTLSLLLYTPRLFPPSSARFLPTLLSLTSLLLTTYALWLLPTRPHPPPTTTRLSAARGQSLEIGPLKKYLDHLNVALSIVLVLFALGAKLKGVEEELYLSLLPGVVFLVCFVARGQLRPVDVGELERLRYGYKGA